MFFEFSRYRILPGNSGRRCSEGHVGQPLEITLVQQRLETNVEDFCRPQRAEGEERASCYSVDLGIKVGIEGDKLAGKQPVLSLFHARNERANVADRDKPSNCEDETKG